MPTRRFFLEGLECACRIGAYDHERLGPQRVIIDAEILLADGSEPKSDSLDEALNYDLIRNAILEIAGSRHFDLQETLASCMMRLALCRVWPRCVCARPSPTPMKIAARLPMNCPDFDPVNSVLC